MYDKGTSITISEEVILENIKRLAVKQHYNLVWNKDESMAQFISTINAVVNICDFFVVCGCKKKVIQAYAILSISKRTG